MRKNDRINQINRMVELLRSYWLSNPSLRLGQLFYTITWDPKDISDPFYMEDSEVKAILKELLSK